MAPSLLRSVFASAFAILLSVSFTFGQTIVYVGGQASGSNGSGSSWANAVGADQLRTRLASAVPGTQFWIAKGEYKTSINNGNSRSDSYVIPSGVQVYGGFAGYEISLAERELTQPSSTTFSGDVGTIGTADDNAFHVVTFVNASTSTRIDGVVVREGRGSDGAGIYNNGSGAGNRSDPTIANCFITENTASRGGGINNYGYQGSTNPLIINCIITNNTAFDDGGGVYNNGYQGQCNPVFVNCLSFGNTAGYGGAYYNEAFGGVCNPTFRNCTIANNSTSRPVTETGQPQPGNGGIYNSVPDGQGSCSPNLINCLIWGNTTQYSSSSNTSIYSKGPATLTITYSTIQEGYAGTGNDNQNPNFLPDYRLSASSPAVNTGDPNSTTASVSVTDLSGRPRIFNGRIDKGVYEYRRRYENGDRLYVTTTGAGNGSGSSWANALPGSQLFVSLLDAYAGASFWIAAGTYKPTLANERYLSFRIASGVQVYGSFAGSESAIAQRNIDANPTVFSGDVGTAGDNADNSYHVVQFKNSGTMTGLDGVTIRDGNDSRNYTALGTYPKGGGGIYLDGSGWGSRCEPLINNCKIIENRSSNAGGGVFLDASGGGYCWPTIDNSVINTNSAATYGGGMYCLGNGGMSGALLTNCSFVSNTVFGFGGAISCIAVNSSTSRSDVVANRCVFKNNYSSVFGGALYLETNIGGKSMPRFTNCLFDGNSAPQQGNVLATQSSFYSESSSTFVNNTFVNNRTSSSQSATFYSITDQNSTSTYHIQSSIIRNVIFASYSDPNKKAPIYNFTYSNIQGSFAGVGNIDADPLFVDPANSNYQLQAGSPSVNTGDPATTTSYVGPVDLAGNPRIDGGRIDMGAYERQTIVAPLMTVQNGNWNDPATWQPQRVPSASDVVLIKHRVNFPASYVGSARLVQ